MKKVCTMLFVCSFVTTAFSQIPTAGLQAHWPFDGNANDISGNGNNGIVHGATPTNDRFGNQNKAYHFDGISNYIEVLNSLTVDIPNFHDFSISFWIKTDTTNNNGYALYKQNYGSFNGYLFITDNTNGGYCTSTGNLLFYTGSAAHEDVCADYPICDDYSNWYHIVGVYYASSNQSLMFVNGVLQSNIGTQSGTISNNKNLYFGSAHNGASALSFFNGDLDGTRIYNVALDQSGVTSLYNEGNPTIGVNEINKKIDNLILFPNPTKGDELMITFFSNTAEKLTLKIYDCLGKIIFEESKTIFEGNNKLKFNLDNFSNGIYSINISSKFKNQSIKFIKN